MLLDDMKSFSKTLIIGPLPPPIGGVSIFLNRLRKSINSEVLDVSQPGVYKFFKLIKTLIFTKCDCVFLNVTTIKLLLICSVFYRGRLILMEHNNRVHERSKLKILITRYIINKFFSVYVVSETIKNNYQILGINGFDIIKVKNSYIPPLIEDFNSTYLKYPDSLKSFISEGNVIIVSGYKVKFIENLDLYGFDTTLRLMSELYSSVENLRLLLVIPDLTDKGEKYISSLIKKYKLNNSSIFILNGNYELWPLFKKANLFIRPTITDGFGISVAEAVDMNCRTIASDVCDRYPGAILYEAGNFDELAKLALFSLKNNDD